MRTDKLPALPWERVAAEANPEGDIMIVAEGRTLVKVYGSDARDSERTGDAMADFIIDSARVADAVANFAEAVELERRLWSQYDNLNLDIRVAERAGDQEAVAAAKTALAELTQTWSTALNAARTALSDTLTLLGLDVGATCAVARQMRQ